LAPLVIRVVQLGQESLIPGGSSFKVEDRGLEGKPESLADMNRIRSRELPHISSLES
jgi:hypothetical protein